MHIVYGCYAFTTILADKNSTTPAPFIYLFPESFESILENRRCSTVFKGLCTSSKVFFRSEVPRGAGRTGAGTGDPVGEAMGAAGGGPGGGIMGGGSKSNLSELLNVEPLLCDIDTLTRDAGFGTGPVGGRVSLSFRAGIGGAVSWADRCSHFAARARKFWGPGTLSLSTELLLLVDKIVIKVIVVVIYFL